jgi:hypothetical protein
MGPRCRGLLLPLLVIGLLGVEISASTPELAAISRPAKEQVDVFVTTVVSDSNRVEYRYTVVNHSSHPVYALLIGWDKHYGGPTLYSEPIGWDGDAVPASSYSAPPGWEFVVQPMEENSLITVKWVMSTPGGMTIKSGDSLSGFMVAVERPDSTYDRGGLWTTYVMGEQPQFGAIRKRW